MNSPLPRPIVTSTSVAPERRADSLRTRTRPTATWPATILSLAMRSDTDRGEGEATDAIATARPTRPITATMKPSIHPKTAEATTPATRATLTDQPTGVSTPSQRAATSYPGIARRRELTAREKPRSIRRSPFTLTPWVGTRRRCSCRR